MVSGIRQYDLAVKRNTPFIDTRNNLDESQGTMLSVQSQSQQALYYMVPLQNNLKITKLERWRPDHWLPEEKRKGEYTCKRVTWMNFLVVMEKLCVSVVVRLYEARQVVQCHRITCNDRAIP